MDKNGIISKIRHFTNRESLINLYHAFIGSHTNYNLLNWACTDPSTLEPIKTKIKKAIRLISFENKYAHTATLFKQHKILPFDAQVQYKQAHFMWKVKHGFIPQPLSETFKTNPLQPHRFILPYPKTKHDKLSLPYTGVITWNKIPVELKDLQSTGSKSFLEKYKESVLSSL